MDFISDFLELTKSAPRPATHSFRSENCHFGDHVIRSKNMYLCYESVGSLDSYYSDLITNCTDCVDCLACAQCELCYECVDCSNVYNGMYLQNCHHSTDISYSLDCVRCKNCFGCFGLRDRQFAIFNKSYPEALYKEKVTELLKNSPARILQIMEAEFKKHPRQSLTWYKSTQPLIGDTMNNCQGLFLSYTCRNVRNSAYVENCINGATPSSENFDCDSCTDISGCYQCVDTNASLNCSFLTECSRCTNVEYSINCSNCKNCFGCVNLQDKEFYILNKSYTKETYELEVAQLKKSAFYGKPLDAILPSLV